MILSDLYLNSVKEVIIYLIHVQQFRKIHLQNILSLTEIKRI